MEEKTKQASETDAQAKTEIRQQVGAYVEDAIVGCKLGAARCPGERVWCVFARAWCTSWIFWRARKTNW